MSIKKVHPTNEEEPEDFKKGLHSVQTFNDLRRRRIQVREATLVLTPKTAQYQHMYQPKISQLTSQDQIVEEEEIIMFEGVRVRFNRALHRLFIVLTFFKTLRFISKLKIKKKLIHQASRKQTIPFLPHYRGIRIWKEIISFNTFLANLVYPIYITYSDYNTYDFVTVLVFIIDMLFFFDLIIEQLTCQIDSNNILLRSFIKIFLHNLGGWLLIDILTILPYKVIIPKTENIFSLRDYFNLLKLLRTVKFFISSDKKLLYHSQDLQNKEITVRDKISVFDYFILIDGRITTIFIIFKNMLILTSSFGCLWQFVLYYEGMEELDENHYSSYVQGLFWAIQTVTVVGYGMNISTSMQYNLVIIWLLIGVGFYSFTIGNLTQLLEQQQSQDLLYYNLDDMESLMNTIIVPEQLWNQVISFLTYNMENNPFWNYRKVIDTLPGQLKKYAICFSQQNLIININLFKLDINIAAKLLPYMKIYHYKQYETIYYLGSPSMDVYFLVTGEVRLCNEQGHSLLNIIEGSIFGEMEILDQVTRKQSAVASQNSIVLIFSVQTFLNIISADEGLTFEIEQLGLRRKMLIKDSHLKIRQNQKVRRVSCIHSQKTTKLTDTKKLEIEKEFRQRISKDSFKFVQQRLLKYIFGRNQERKWRLLNRFRDAVRRVMKFIKEQKELNRKRRNSYLGLKMITNFKGTTENDQQMIKVLNKIQKQKRLLVKTLRQIIAHVRSGVQAPIFIVPSPYFHLILQETKQLQRERKLLEQQNQVSRQQIKKIDIFYQYRRLNQFWEKLEENLELLKNVRGELRFQQMEVDGVYYEIQGVIKEII